MEEVWKDIQGFEGYQISSLGSVKSFKRNRILILKQVKDNYGYFIVTLQKGSMRYGKKVHRLIAEAFIPNPENKKEVNHENGIKDDNRICNLSWNTFKENQDHATLNGLRPRGIKNKNCKICEDIALLIKHELINNPNMFRKDIAIKFNTTKNIVDDIARKKTWAWLSV